MITHLINQSKKEIAEKQTLLGKIFMSFVLAYAGFLLFLAVFGICFMIYALVSGEVDTNNITWGLIDTLG